MIKLLKEEYWSVADAFILPLTGLNKSETYELTSYLFWNQFTIDNMHLTIMFSYDVDEYDEFVSYCKRYIFPVLDKQGYLIESYDIPGRTVFVLDMSEYLKDIEVILEGRYSKMSDATKNKIQKFHKFEGNKMPVHIYSVMYPDVNLPILDNKTPIEYISENFGLDIDRMNRVGEIGSKYYKMAETLFTDFDDMCQDDSL